MSNDKKWIDWDKPETILSRSALEMRMPLEYIKLWAPGAYKFNDGTTQGWKIDQIYDTNDALMTQIAPFTDPTTKKFYGFTLGNHQNLALAASANPLIVFGTKATSLDIYLESPDLQNNSDWQNIKGYSLDLQRNFFSYCINPPAYFVQLQAKFWHLEKKELTPYGEWDATTKLHIFHPVKLMQPYHLIWTPPAFTAPELQLRSLRIRLTQPNFSFPGMGECLAKGAWLVGNISPEK